MAPAAARLKLASEKTRADAAARRSDDTEADAKAHFQKMGIEGPLGGGGRSGEWAMVDFNSPMRQELKRLFGVPPRPALSLN